MYSFRLFDNAAGDLSNELRALMYCRRETLFFTLISFNLGLVFHSSIIIINAPGFFLYSFDSSIIIINALGFLLLLDL